MIPQPDYLSPSKLKVLLVILKLARSPRPITIRRIASEYGCHVHHIGIVMQELRRRGLISYQDFRASTIRPRCFLTVLPSSPPRPSTPERQA